MNCCKCKGTGEFWALDEFGEPDCFPCPKCDGRGFIQGRDEGQPSPPASSPATSLSDPEPYDFYESQRERGDREYLSRLERT